MKNKDYEVASFPKMRRFALDAGYFGRRRHIVHALTEVDVTSARQLMRRAKAESGQSLSFTAFVVLCLGKAVESNRVMQAYLNWRKRLVIHHDVNVNVMIELDVDGRKVPLPRVLQAVNRKSYLEIHEEIRRVKARPELIRELRQLRWFLALPAFGRRLFAWVAMRIPQLLRSQSSSVLVTAVGMFGDGGGWGIPFPSFTLTLTLGGISEKPVVREGEIVAREILDLTVSIDHDVVDGAPAARFVGELKSLIEEGYGLDEEAVASS